MRIERVELSHIQIPMREPFRISSGAVSVKDAIIVRVFSEGLVGYGECSAMAGSFYNLETPETSLIALRELLVPQLMALEAATPENFNVLCMGMPTGCFARAGVETALWDLKAKGEEKSLVELLGGTRKRVESGLAVGICDTIAELLNSVERYLGDGYRRLKIKIQPGWDVEPVREIRRKFGNIGLFVDANCAYTRNDIEVFKRLDEFDLMMFEQPLGETDLEGHALIQKAVRTPICMDESIHDLADVDRAIEMGACRVVNIKIQRMGGLQPARELHDLCMKKGIPVWCGTMPEAGIGCAQGLALATLPNFRLPTDIEPSLRFYPDDIITPLIVMEKDGTISAPSGPGLGYQVEESKIKKYQIASWTFKR